MVQENKKKTRKRDTSHSKNIEEDVVFKKDGKVYWNAETVDI